MDTTETTTQDKRAEFLGKIENVLIKDLHEYIMEKANKLVNSGAIDVDGWSGDLAEPRAALCAIFRECEHQYAMPAHTPKAKRDWEKHVKNLSLFT